MPCPDPADWPIEVFILGVAGGKVVARDAEYAPHHPQAQAINSSSNGATNGHASNGHSNGSTTSEFLHRQLLRLAPNTLRYLAKVVRSKNSGPFEVTMDVSCALPAYELTGQVMFDTEEMFERAELSGVLSRKLITRLYGVPDNEILTCMFVSASVKGTAHGSSAPRWLGR